MSLFAGPAEHAANPPETWQAVKFGRRWSIATADGKTLDPMHETKRSALEGIQGGSVRKLYEQEGRWYAGERIPGWRPWAELQAEHARAAAARLEREHKRAAEEVARAARERPLREALEGVGHAVDLAQTEVAGTRASALELLTVGHVVTAEDVESVGEWLEDDARAVRDIGEALESVDAGEVIAEARGPLLEAVERLADAIRLGLFDAPATVEDAARMLEDMARELG